MAIRTWVGRFCVADGHVDEEGPWLGSLIRQRTDEEADELYVLIEPASPGSAEFTSQLVDVVAQLYNKDPLSLTGALTRSLRAAHDHLREWNHRSLPEHQVGAGQDRVGPGHNLTALHEPINDSGREDSQIKRRAFLNLFLKAS